MIQAKSRRWTIDAGKENAAGEQRNGPGEMQPGRWSSPPKVGECRNREARHHKQLGEYDFWSAELFGKRTIKNKRQDKEQSRLQECLPDNGYAFSTNHREGAMPALRLPCITLGIFRILLISQVSS